MNEIKPLSVKQLNMYIKSLFESDLHLMNIAVTGELSNFKNHYQSGHWYFTVKDNESAIRCVMFNNYASRVTFNPSDGMRVVLRGRVSVYEKDGQYMLYVSSMAEFGQGELSIQFEKVKQKLKAEGLFDEENKRPLPKFPEKIAVITSDTGAAVRDMQNILNMRYPLCKVILCPVLVQGINAADSIIKTLDRVYKLNGIDVIILGRGGGSAEDLAAFNDEALARKIFESPFPIISAVGHETDFTISDFVADVRASTPSHAAELAVPDISDLKLRVDMLSAKTANLLKGKYQIAKSDFDKCAYKISPLRFYEYIKANRKSVDTLYDRLKNRQKIYITEKREKFTAQVSKLDALSPLKVLSRGYTAVKSGENYIKSVNHLLKGDKINITFSDGTADCTVLNVKSNT